MSLVKRLTSRLEDPKDSSFSHPPQPEPQHAPNHEWTEIKSSSNMLTKRAHHATVILNHSMYLYGGYEAGGAGILSDFMRFDIEKKTWHPVTEVKSSVGSRHSHSLTAWGNKLFLFGGILNTFESSNQVFSFELGTSSDWKQQLCTGEIPPPLNSHQAVVHNDQMLVFGGQQKDKYSEFMYSLDLKTNEWKKVCKLQQKGLKPRSDFSMNLYQDKLLIFGGKNDDAKYNQLWSYQIQDGTFIKIQNQQSIQPAPRSGHSASIYQDYLLVFGGTSGITHERNDLICFNLKTNSWHKHWPDQQSELYQNPNSTDHQLNGKSFKKSRSNSFSKMKGSGCNQKGIDAQKMSNSNVNDSPYKKYRHAMKEQNYYNENYPFYGDRQSLLGNKHKKNDLLVDLERETKEDNKNNNRASTSGPRKMELHLSQTFESLNNSILTSIVPNGNRSEVSNNAANDDKTREKLVRQPKPRDGHTCEVYGKNLIIFGGDRHHMSFNDVILISLDKVINSDTKSKGKIEEQQ